MESLQHRRRQSSPPASAHHHHHLLHQQLQHPQPQHVASHAHPLHTHIPPSATFPLRTNQSTPASSPGLFSPTNSRHIAPPTSLSEANSPAHELAAPYLHPLQSYKVRETHKALIDSDTLTGRKLINQYEVIEEIGRGMHGKVKLARNIETGENVAIKIIPRFSKKRRLGKVTALNPEDKTKKEIAILKKIRHPNVVALLEVIDDPELKKIYMVLEHAEYGEIIWRKKGLPHICLYERRRAEREMRGEPLTSEEEKYDQLLERRQMIKEMKRARMAEQFPGASDYWSVEHGAADEPSSSYGQRSRVTSKEDFALSDGGYSLPGSHQASRGPSRSHSIASVAAAAPSELGEEVYWDDDMETPGPLRSNPNSATALDGNMYGSYADGQAFRGRAPSMADSIISHMSSIDYFPQPHDSFADDFSYVPCFTIDHARSTFRDTLLGLEYLHYQGVVHRDIKPANLLWSKDHRVKISDFGVSYFGRPIRDGEPDDTVSESEAKDFDDDVELSKTVGTPAFFAPELCYTDANKEQPKVSEQIDVWSLGVTLYCLIFARIPFLAEDEFQMFKKIATEDVYIPRRRLMPVDPSTSPTGTSLYQRHNNRPYRNDNDLEYEEVDGLLYDLLRQMLTKNPEQRIKLRDIKRHPWVIQGVQNPIGWLDDTDPARPSSGRKIQVDDRDVSDAVVPITFLERARSAMKKAVGKVIYPLVERSESKTRHRASSSVASSAGDSMMNGPPTTYTKNDRRRSLLPDDNFLSNIPPLRNSASNVGIESVAYDPMATVLPPLESGPDVLGSEMSKPLPISQSSLSHTLRHVRSLSRTSEAGRRSRIISESQTTPATPVQGSHRGVDYMGDWARNVHQSGLDDEEDDNSRSRSADRSLFASSDKRASPQVGLTQAVAPGDIQRPIGHAHPRPIRSVDLTKSRNPYSTSSPLSVAMSPGERPQSSHAPERHALDTNEAHISSQSPMPHQSNSNPESFVNASEAVTRYPIQDLQQSTGTLRRVEPPSVPQSPSPDTDDWSHHHGGPARGNTMTTVKSSSTESIDGMGTPLTSPSEVTSPISMNCPTKTASERMLAFQSDPSLPALLSGASSVSADLEAELLGRPGIVSTKPSLLETTDSLTPPADIKENSDGFPLDQVFGNPPAMISGPLAVRFNPAPESSQAYGGSDSNDGDGSNSSSDDDGILLMAKSKRKSGVPSGTVRRIPFEARRRDTNISTTSVETAKQVPFDTNPADELGQNTAEA